MEAAKQRPEEKAFQAEQTLRCKLTWSVLEIDIKTMCLMHTVGKGTCTIVGGQVWDHLVLLDKELGFHPKHDEKALEDFKLQSHIMISHLGTGL